MSSTKKISKKYQKKTHYEHIIDVPDTYIGGIDTINEEMYILNDTDENNIHMAKEMITYVPGLERIFEEILLNSFDQTVRENANVSMIKVTIDKDTGIISVYNNGEGIPVVKHEEYKIWIPSMIFGELLTSSNYDKNEKRITGGKNGYGAKLTNIFSKYFKIETVDEKEGKKFVMVWENNMLKKHKPKVTKNSGKGYVKVIFKPDYERFGLTGLTDDILKLMIKI